MTPRELKEAFYKAAETEDADYALVLAKFLKNNPNWWVWQGKAANLDGTEKTKIALYDGHCQICDAWFKAGTEIYWKCGSCAHLACWTKKFRTNRSTHKNNYNKTSTT